MSRATDYTNAAQQRLVKVILALFADVVDGVSPGALAKAVGCNASSITRDLDNLSTAGVAQRVEESDRWRLTARLPQQSIKVWSAIDHAERRLEQARSRFNRPD